MGGKGLLWAEEEDGRQWALGGGSEGRTLYIPVETQISHIALEIGLRDPNAISDDILQTESSVALQYVADGDANDDTDLSIVTGSTVTTDAIAYGTGNRRVTAVITPDITVPSGSWIRPVTTAPTGIVAYSQNSAVFTVWFKRSTGHVV